MAALAADGILPALEPLLEAVRWRATGIGSQLHGERHCQCVAHIGGELAAAVPGTDPVVVFLFGLLHDTMRENEGSDPGHGPRAAAHGRSLQDEGLLRLDERRLELLTLACELHADGLTTGDPTLGVCWDADRLNLWRVGTTPLPELLSTEPARREAWRVGAPALARAPYTWPALLALAARPADGTFWIEAGRLLAGAYAGGAAGRVEALAQAGVTLFVDLTEAGELEAYDGLVGAPARHRRFGVRDFSVASPANMRRTLDALDEEIAAGGLAYVHCRGGCGRTGTTVACWLVRHGVAPEAALARFAAACGEDCPETEEQRAFVLGWPVGG
jgi:uncharacterized protein